MQKKFIYLLSTWSVKIHTYLPLQKAGITFKVDNKLPNLVNLNEDPQLSEMLLYVIKEGQTRVGRMCANSKHEIQLNGALIADNHWSVYFKTSLNRAIMAGMIYMSILWLITTG